jgi:hypothetical protein
MRRKLPLIALFVVALTAAACTNPTAPRNDDPNDPPEDSSSMCGVVVGSQTRTCDDTTGEG